MPYKAGAEGISMCLSHSREVPPKKVSHGQQRVAVLVVSFWEGKEFARLHSSAPGEALDQGPRSSLRPAFNWLWQLNPVTKALRPSRAREQRVSGAPPSNNNDGMT